MASFYLFIFRFFCVFTHYCLTNPWDFFVVSFCFDVNGTIDSTFPLQAIAKEKNTLWLSRNVSKRSIDTKPHFLQTTDNRGADMHSF